MWTNQQIGNRFLHMCEDTERLEPSSTKVTPSRQWKKHSKFSALTNLKIKMLTCRGTKTRITTAGRDEENCKVRHQWVRSVRTNITGPDGRKIRHDNIEERWYKDPWIQLNLKGAHHTIDDIRKCDEVGKNWYKIHINMINLGIQARTGLFVKDRDQKCK